MYAIRSYYVYRKLLRSFVTDFGNSRKELDAAIAAADFKTAERLVHTIKGASGNLGAEELQKSAAVFDSHLKEEKSDDKAKTDFLNNLEFLIENLKTAGFAENPPEKGTEGSVPGRFFRDQRIIRNNFV